MFKFPATTTAAVAAAFLMATPIAVSAQSAASVIQVNGCAASGATDSRTFTSPFGVSLTQPGLPPMLMIDYVNVSTKPAVSVDFGIVNDGKLVTMVNDIGMYAPQASIMHAYGIAQVPSKTMGLMCVPLTVKYADGTIWMNPAMPAH
jgi:hypothetical protein